MGFLSPSSSDSTFLLPVPSLADAVAVLHVINNRNEFRGLPVGNCSQTLPLTHGTAVTQGSTGLVP